jgi:hypothetical protein
VNYWHHGDHGVTGNGRMSMIENNGDEIATLIDGWIASHVS